MPEVSYVYRNGTQNEHSTQAGVAPSSAISGARNIGILRILDKIYHWAIGESAFQFGWTEAPDSPMSTIWYMEFFSKVPFGAKIRNSNAPFDNSDQNF
jgi:hypothetical protein